MKVPVYNLRNEVIGETELPSGIFGARWNPALVKQVLDAQLANRRRPWAHAKGRGEVRGGGKKPWRQKGSGRARHGSRRSPIWVGGGVAHGPSKFRDYTKKVNRKMRRLALASALSRKLKDREVKIFDTLFVESPKTKILSETLKPILGLKKREKKFDLLLVVAKDSTGVIRAASNLVKTKALRSESLNLYDVLNHKYVFIEGKAVTGIPHITKTSS